MERIPELMIIVCGREALKKMGSSVIVEQESLKHGEKIIPHEILTKRYLERNKKLDNQKIREDNKRTTKPTQIRRHEL